ncbi:MAG: glycosyltransferase family 1 protein, partial [Tumebacillaceae bacterium]
MRIGVDARSLCGHKTGIGHYTDQILQQLARLDEHNEYFLYAREDFNVEPGTEQRMNKRVRDGKPSFLWIQHTLPRLLQEDRIDLYWGPNYAVPLIHPAETKIVMTIHDMVSFVYPETLPRKTVIHNRWGLPLYVRHAQHILTDSESSKSDILRFLGVGSPDITVTPLGANPRFFHAEGDAQAALANHGIRFPYVLSVGTLEPRKNLTGTIRAFARLVADGLTEHHLVVIGARGWKYGAIDDLLDSQPGLRERVHFLGYVSDEELPLIYREAALFVYPSFYEGFGLPVLEAMASGVPVITSTASSLPEVVGDAGVQIDPESIEQLSAAMKGLLLDERRANSLAAAGRERAQAFTWSYT